MTSAPPPPVIATRHATRCTAPHAGHALVALAGLAIALPWLNPFTLGPTPNTLPLLVSGFCTLVLIAVWGGLAQRTGARIHPDTLLSAWAGAALLSGAMGLAQYFGWADALAPWVHPSPAGEAFANLRQRNQFASLTSIGLVAVVYGATHLATTHRGWLRTARAFLLVAALALLAMANAASASRTGALQWVMVAVLALGWSQPGKRHGAGWAMGGLLLYALAVATLPSLLHALTGITHTGLLDRLAEPPGCESRRILWANVLELIAQKPLWGWGWGELKFAHYSHPYSGMRFCAILDNAHNLPLQLAVELGVPLAVALCTLTGWLLWRGKPWRETNAVRQCAWAVLAIIGLHSLVEYPLWYGPFQMAVGLCVAVLWRKTDQPRNAMVRGATAIAWVGALLVLLYTAWDYTRVSQLYLPVGQRLAIFRVDTLEKARASHLFANAVRFAELTTTPLTHDNAAQQYALARQLRHFSPEPRVLERVLESAERLGLNDDTVQRERQQFESAYPEAFAHWQAARAPLN